jgi:hypothetical protein
MPPPASATFFLRPKGWKWTIISDSRDNPLPLQAFYKEQDFSGP